LPDGLPECRAWEPGQQVVDDVVGELAHLDRDDLRPGRPAPAVATASLSASSRVDEGCPSPAETTAMVRGVIGRLFPARCRPRPGSQPRPATLPSWPRAWGRPARWPGA